MYVPLFFSFPCYCVNTACETILPPIYSLSHYTPRLWRVGCNSIDIVCVSVCLSVSLSRPNGRTYRLEFQHGGQVEGYLGQVNRSKVKVTWSKDVLMDISMMECLLRRLLELRDGRDGRDESSCQNSESLIWLRNKTKSGVLKAYSFYM